MPVTRLILFDLDGTLMSSGGAGRRAMDSAFRELHGIDHAFRGIVPDGLTDPMIFREIFRLRGIDVAEPDRAIAELALTYEGYLEQEMPASAHPILMPGVPELLTRLDLEADLLLGLLTGNFERTARIKLSRFDLNRFFPFGAFSSDNEDRAQLVPLAVQRAERHAGRKIGLDDHITIIGDTPRDAQAALANGVRSVGVATGSFSTIELENAGADHAFDDLSDTEEVLSRLLTD